tara:strand:- start:461 stop:736 length:276 start_codon:yes stop_codon:yes gene_type:complete
MLGILIVTTDAQIGGIKMNQIQAYEFVGKGNDEGGIFTVTLKGDKEDLVFNCKDGEAWLEAIEWWDKSIINISQEMRNQDVIHYKDKHPGF